MHMRENYNHVTTMDVTIALNGHMALTTASHSLLPAHVPVSL
jgi:hypothetical protein